MATRPATQLTGSPQFNQPYNQSRDCTRGLRTRERRRLYSLSRPAPRSRITSASSSIGSMCSRQPRLRLIIFATDSWATALQSPQSLHHKFRSNPGWHDEAVPWVCSVHVCSGMFLLTYPRLGWGVGHCLSASGRPEAAIVPASSILLSKPQRRLHRASESVQCVWRAALSKKKRKNMRAFAFCPSYSVHRCSHQLPRLSWPSSVEPG